jgi:hypothetical protein
MPDARRRPQVLADLERKAERVRAGLLTTAESRTAGHQAVSFGEHVAAYVESLAAQGATTTHRDTVRRNLERLSSDRPFGRLADLKCESLERWRFNDGFEKM